MARSRGSYAGHLDTATALANAGFVVAALTHNGDSWRDQSRPTAIWERPRQLKLLTDYMLGAWSDHGRLDANRVGAFGFSAGGLTAPAAAGGEPDLRTLPSHCKAHPAFEDCQIMEEHPLLPDTDIVWTHDPRIKAVVSAAPALGFAFGPTAWRRSSSQYSSGGPRMIKCYHTPIYAEAVRLALPTPPETHVVADAGHYDFLKPCSADLATRMPAICTSKPGFDRAAFHERFDHDIVAFFKRTLQ
ncbi:alpha/beta hydrolase family protein [Bradyrhizobium japonicum]